MFEGLIDFIESSLFGLINRITSEEKSGVRQIEAIVGVLLGFAQKNRGMTRVLIGDALVMEEERLQSRINQVHDRIEAALKQALRFGITQQEFVAELDVTAHANLLMSFVTGRWHQFAKSGFKRDPAELWAKFQDEYLPNPDAPWGRFAFSHVVTDSTVDGDTTIEASIVDNGEPITITGRGNGPIAAFLDAFMTIEGAPDMRVLDYAEHALSSGGDAVAAAYVECSLTDADGDSVVMWGVGIDANIVTASLKAVISAVNRARG